MNQIQLTRLTLPDYEAYFAFRLASLREYPHMYATDANDWENTPREVIERHLQGSETNQLPIVGAWHDEELVGMAGIKPDFRPTVQHKATVWGLCVAPTHQRQGIGTKLLASAINTAREIESLRQLRAVVNATNQEAVHLFHSAGFQEFGREPRAKYIDGVYHDQVYFWYSLDDEN
jgi:L-amino acid N-acyltransferase YncA